MATVEERRGWEKKEEREGVGKIKIKAKETSEENGRDIKIRQMIKKHKKWRRQFKN